MTAQPFTRAEAERIPEMPRVLATVEALNETRQQLDLYKRLLMPNVAAEVAKRVREACAEAAPDCVTPVFLRKCIGDLDIDAIVRNVLEGRP